MDNDPQPRWILDDPWFAEALLGEIRDLTRILYPEARIPETPMPELERLRTLNAELRSVLQLYIDTYADTQTHPTPTQETRVILMARTVLAKARGEP